MQLALDTETWDIGLDGSGNIAVLVDPSALLAQRIQCRLQTFKGECFLDRSVGVPYYEEILKKNPDLGRVRSCSPRLSRAWTAWQPYFRSN